MIRASVVTVSDRSFRKERIDASGPAVANLLVRLPASVKQLVIIPDEKVIISRTLRHFSDVLLLDLVITTGGTGVDPRDVTPEATREVIDREIPGMAEAMRVDSQRRVSTAMLSRAIVGVRRRTLIVNLPGNPDGARENLEVILPVLPFAIEKIRGAGGECAP